jgi:hypothetical protein
MNLRHRELDVLVRHEQVRGSVSHRGKVVDRTLGLHTLRLQLTLDCGQQLAEEDVLAAGLHNADALHGERW